jgi:hypothetical protein
MSRRVGRLQHPTNDSSHLSPWYRDCGKLHLCLLCYLTCSATVQGWIDNVDDDNKNNNNKSSLFTIHVNIILPSMSRSSTRLLSVRCSNHKKNTCTHLKKYKDNMTKYIPLCGITFPPKITFPNNTRKIQDAQHSYLVVPLSMGLCFE